MNKVQIAPSILSANFLELKKQVKDLENCGIEVLHIDVMDGHFVPNLTFGSFIVRELRAITDMILDCHLMVLNPDHYIEAFAKAGADVITVHQESTRHIHRTLQLIRATGKKVGISLNPSTSEDSLEYLYDELDLILLMSVNPGFGGQKFIPQTLKKIKTVSKEIKKRKASIILEVDGGVNSTNVNELVMSGVDWLVAGSAVFGADSLEAGIDALRKTL